MRLGKWKKIKVNNDLACRGAECAEINFYVEVVRDEIQIVKKITVKSNMLAEMQRTQSIQK